MASAHPTLVSADSRIQRAEKLTICLAKGLFGGACFLTGIALTLTLFLLPVGVPMALVGVAILLAAGGES
jgi:hypothetical protein